VLSERAYARFCTQLVVCLVLTTTAVPAMAEQNLETGRNIVSRKLDSVASYIDRFFDDPVERTDSAGTLLRVRQRVTTSRHDETEFKTRVSARLYLPNLSNRFSLAFRGDDRLEPVGDGGEEQAIDGLHDATGTPAVSLNSQPLARRYFSSNLSLGYRLKSNRFYTGARLRYRYPMSTNWRFQAVQRLRAYSDSEIDADLRFDFDRTIGERQLFRQQVLLQWRDADDEIDDLRTTITSSFVSQLSQASALRFDWVNQFEPNSELKSSSLNFRYRRTVGYDWLFFEVAPRLSFEKEHDWSADPGLQLSLEVVFNRNAIPVGLD